MYNEIITFYAKTPPNKGILSEYDISFGKKIELAEMISKSI